MSNKTRTKIFLNHPMKIKSTTKCWLDLRKLPKNVTLNNKNERRRQM